MILDNSGRETQFPQLQNGTLTGLFRGVKEMEVWKCPAHRAGERQWELPVPPAHLQTRPAVEPAVEPALGLPLSSYCCRSSTAPGWQAGQREPVPQQELEPGTKQPPGEEKITGRRAAQGGSRCTDGEREALGEGTFAGSHGRVQEPLHGDYAKMTERPQALVVSDGPQTCASAWAPPQSSGQDPGSCAGRPGCSPALLYPHGLGQALSLPGPRAPVKRKGGCRLQTKGVDTHGVIRTCQPRAFQEKTTCGLRTGARPPLLNDSDCPTSCNRTPGHTLAARDPFALRTQPSGPNITPTKGEPP